MITPTQLSEEIRKIEAIIDLRFPDSLCLLGTTPERRNGILARFEKATDINLDEKIADFFQWESQPAFHLTAEEVGSGKSWKISESFFDLDFLVSGNEDVSFGKISSTKHRGFLYDETIDIKVAEKINSLFVWGEAGCGNYIMIDLAGSNKNPDVYLLRYPSRLFKLKLQFWEYIDHLLKFRGVHLWEKYFTDNPEEASHPTIRDNFHQNFQEIFPDSDTELPPPIGNDLTPNTFEILASQRNYAERFDRMVDGLRKKEGLHVAQYERWAGVPIYDLQKGWYGANGLLDDDMLAFYSRVRRVRLLWHYKVAGQTVAEADFLLCRFEEMLGGKSPIYAYRHRWDYDINEKMGWDAPETAGMRLFSDGPYGETLIKFDAQAGKPMLYALQEDEPFKLTVDFKEYIELLLENGGIWRWQFYLTDPAEYTQLPSPARFQLNMRKLFPDADLSRYRKK